MQNTECDLLAKILYFNWKFSLFEVKVFNLMPFIHLEKRNYVKICPLYGVNGIVTSMWFVFSHAMNKMQSNLYKETLTV